MGVFHFMGLGRAVGSVTCAVDYIEKCLDHPDSEEVKKLFSTSGGISHVEQDKGKIEAIVLVTSSEVIGNQITSYGYKNCDHPGPVRQEVVRNLKKVWKRYGAEGRKVFWCEVDIDNFWDCFDKIVKVAYRFSAPGKQGKEIWCNLTGGTNSIGLALISMARWTGISTKHYLISQRKEYQKEVTVPPHISIKPNKDGYFNIVPFVKTAIDTANFYEILFELESLNRSIKTQELFHRLQAKNLYFQNLTFDTFKRQYMLKIHGLGYTDYIAESDENIINMAGKQFVNELENLQTAMELESKILSNEMDIVAESKQWEWFKEIDVI